MIGTDVLYCGIQERTDGSKIAIFSVWDGNQEKTALVSKDENCIDARFDGEGEGRKCIRSLEWEHRKAEKFSVNFKCKTKSSIWHLSARYEKKKQQKILYKNAPIKSLQLS